MKVLRGFGPGQITLALLLMLAMLSAPVRAVDPITGIVIADPQPTADQLMPGLSVRYNYEYYTHVDEIETLPSSAFDGEPLKDLSHRTIDGDVLTADRPMGVAAHIRGFIEFKEAGTWNLRIESNDGVKAWVGGQRIWFDPEIHANRWSPPLPLVIESPGWYELNINYYQKKGTSALQLVWTPPSGGEETLVPTDSLAYLK